MLIAGVRGPRGQIWHPTGWQPRIIVRRHDATQKTPKTQKPQNRADRASERRPSISHGREMRCQALMWCSSPAGRCGVRRLPRLPRVLRSVVLRHRHASGCDSGAPGSKRSAELSEEPNSRDRPALACYQHLKRTPLEAGLALFPVALEASDERDESRVLSQCIELRILRE